MIANWSSQNNIPNECRFIRCMECLFSVPDPVLNTDNLGSKPGLQTLGAVQ